MVEVLGGILTSFEWSEKRCLYIQTHSLPFASKPRRARTKGFWYSGLYLCFLLVLNMYS